MLHRKAVLSSFCLAASLLTFAGCDSLIPTGGPKTNPMFVPDEPVAEADAKNDAMAQQEVEAQPTAASTDEASTDSTTL